MMWVIHLEMDTEYEHIGFPYECSPKAPTSEDAFEKQIDQKTSTDVSFSPSYSSACSK